MATILASVLLLSQAPAGLPAPPPIVEYQLPRATTTQDFACGPVTGRLVIATERVGPPRVTGLSYDGRAAPVGDLAPVNAALRPISSYMGADVLCLGLDPAAPVSLILVFRGYDRFTKAVTASYEFKAGRVTPSSFTLHLYPPYVPWRSSDP